MLSSCSHVSVKVSALPHVLLRSSEPLHKPGPHPDSIQMCSFLYPQEDRCRLKKGCKISTGGAFVKTNKKSTKSASLKANWQATISPRTLKTPSSPTVSTWSHTILSLADFFISLVESRECWEEFDPLASGRRRRTF